MKPFSIALSINLAFFAIWGLFFTLGINRPELIPLMTSLQTAINVLFAVGFFVDRKKPIGMAFVWTAAIAGVVTVAAYLVLIKYRDMIGVEENYTAYLHSFTTSLLRA